MIRMMMMRTAAIEPKMIRHHFEQHHQFYLHIIDSSASAFFSRF